MHYQKDEVLELLNKDKDSIGWWKMKRIDKLKKGNISEEFEMPSSHLRAVSWNTITVL